MIESSIICDSISPQGKRLTTFRLRYPKWIHGEFLTHRVISRNASSSRAVPTKKLLEDADGSTRKSHYTRNDRGEQAIDTIYRVGWGPEFCAGNVLKYLRRNKDEAHSNESAKRYYEWLQKLAMDQAAGGKGHVIDVALTLDEELTTEEHLVVHP